jgi:hypothetical protein
MNLPQFRRSCRSRHVLWIGIGPILIIWLGLIVTISAGVNHYTFIAVIVPVVTVFWLAASQASLRADPPCTHLAAPPPNARSVPDFDPMRDRWLDG